MKTSNRLPKINNTKDIVLPYHGIDPNAPDEDIDVHEGVRKKDADGHIWRLDKETGEWVLDMLDANDLPLVTLPVRNTDKEIPQYQGMAESRQAIFLTKTIEGL